MAPNIFLILAQAIQLYEVILLIRIIMSWINPYPSWHKQPFQLIYQLTEPVMAPFRRLIPPMAGIDFSPMLLFLLLNLVANLLRGLA